MDCPQARKVCQACIWLCCKGVWVRVSVRSLSASSSRLVFPFACDFAMGGDSYHPHGHHTFKEVWSPSGGWWCDPKGWRRNTLFAVGLYLAAQYMVFSYSAEHEKRYTYPKSWTPGLAYAKHLPPKPEDTTH